MNSNLAAVRSIPGRSQANHCRVCNEIETLPHVLGFCRMGELLRINRHNKVRSQIANCFRVTNKYEVFEEVHCISNTGSTKRADIVIIDKNNKKGYIIDPTVRFERGENQVHDVHLEKKEHYEPCCEYFSKKYGTDKFEVIGLLFGARGIITKFTVDIFKRFGLNTNTLEDIGLQILRDSLTILHNHLYTKN